MATYLPKDTSPGSAYQEGGGLYALGLIHANHGGDIIDYLLSQLKNASNDVRSLFPQIYELGYCPIHIHPMIAENTMHQLVVAVIV